jgi:predicted Zn-dependent protease
MLGQGLLLSRYSRDNEREADFLGNEYMVKAGYPSRGFVGLMEMLNTLNKEKPNASQMLFSTHPMSSERLSAAVQRENGMYQQSKIHSVNRERYMDNIASLREKKEGIELLQQGETYLAKKEYDKAENTFKQSLLTLKEDYTAHVLMSKCLMIRKKPSQALSYANTATQLYPSEAQGYYLAGMANSDLDKYSDAYQNFDKCDQVLPGNPQIQFYKGYSLDKKGENAPAATHYMTYLEMINYQSNPYAKHAVNRLKEWGYVK